MKDHETLPLVPIKRGKGVYLLTLSNLYLDGVLVHGGLIFFGHCHPCINQKVKEQIETLEHVIFAGFTWTDCKTFKKTLCFSASRVRKMFVGQWLSIEVVANELNIIKTKGEKRPFCLVRKQLSWRNYRRFSGRWCEVIQRSFWRLFTANPQAPVPNLLYFGFQLHVHWVKGLPALPLQHLDIIW